MAYEIRSNKSAAKSLLKLTKQSLDQLEPDILELANNPRPHGSKKLFGVKDTYRIRIGAYRVIYRIDDDNQMIFILKIAHRRDAYRP